ncbi:hypothetical protein J4411_02475 [Candidatus Pacearchaeota archaeon]|nr:hypothetical protein [Candidatus Pacearchaeota archaeon]
MKKVMFAFIFLLLTLSFVSSAAVETKADYSRGENFIARISGTFYNPLAKSNIYFYRGPNAVSFGVFSLEEIEGDYFVYFTISPDRTPSNYSIVVKGATYYNGNQWVNEDFGANFEIPDKKVFATVSPAFSVLNKSSYNLTIQSLNFDNKISVSYGPEESTFGNVILNPGEKKNVTLLTPSRGFENIIFTNGTDSYSVLVYSTFDGVPPPPYNGTVEPENESTQNETNENSPSFWDILFGNTNNDKNNSVQNETNESNQDFWDILFGNNETNKTSNNYTNITIINNNSNGTLSLKTCSELKFKICNDDEKCEGALVSAKDAQCCNGNCVAKDSDSGIWGTVGWIILGAAVLFFIWFFMFKFRRTRRIPSRFGRRFL